MTRAVLRRLAADQEGVTAVEFGLLIMPLLAMIMGFGELAYRSYVRANLQAALNDVARSAVVETPKIGGTGTLESRIEAEVKRRMAALVSDGAYTFDIENFTGFDAVQKPESLVTDVNNNGRYDAGDCWVDSNPNRTFDTSSGRSGVGGADDVVVYDVSLEARSLFPVDAVMPQQRRFGVTASTLVRAQPYANQRQPEVVC